ncbi:unnamed protein product [Urochloa decumbens]|uniref:Uncharacterized protein n=1 Tax=Urochloa decumbens TaxID=240449 RepID=A0ABC9ADQ9_9POAL
MVKERPPDWMPNFEYTTSRSHYPSSSAPGLRSSRASSNPPQSPENSDDEESSICHLTNRCSPKVVYSLVSKLSEFKKEMVRDMDLLDTEDSELVLTESKRIYIHEKDVGIVFGIPYGDIDISSLEITAEQIDSIRASCGLTSKDSRSFKGLEYILEKHLDDRSTRLELDSFKIAFVIFVIGHLFAPSGKHDCLHLDFWGALKDTELLYRINWCRYVYSHVLEAAQKARDEMIRKNRITNLLGCHIFLQVLFLDNVDIRGLNKKHEVIPRIKLFDADSLKRMAAMCESRGGNDFNCFIAIRPAEGSAYMRHMYQSTYTGPRRHATPLPSPPLPAGSTLEGSSEAINADTYSFREHSDFGAYIRTRYPHLNKLYAIDYIKLHNAKNVSNIGTVELEKIHKKPGPSTCVHTHPGFEDKMKSPSEPTSSVLGIENAVVGRFPSTTQAPGISTEVSTAGSLKRVAADLNSPDLKKPCLRIDNSALAWQSFNSPGCAPPVTPKNKSPVGTSSLTPETKKIQGEIWSAHTSSDLKRHPIDFEPPSFDLGFDKCPAAASCVTPISQLVICAKDVKDNFLNPMLTEFHIVDAIIRRLNQIDVSVTEGEINLRWRHFMESDFAMQAISGFHPEQTQSALNQFIHTNYSVPHCKNIIVPLLVHDIWSAYMFDLDEGSCTYSRPCPLAGSFCSTWSLPKFEIEYPKLCDLFTSEDSAFCMLHLARYFNGEELVSLITKDNLQHVRSTFMFEALSLHHNEADLPSMPARLTRPPFSKAASSLSSYLLQHSTNTLQVLLPWVPQACAGTLCSEAGALGSTPNGLNAMNRL